MSSVDQDPTETLRSMLESGKQIRLGSGFVAKTSHVTITLILVWGVVLARMTESFLLDAALLAGASLVTGVVVWWIRRTQSFVQTNPSLALLEGAQFLEYHKFEAQAKGVLNPPPGTLVEAGMNASSGAQSGSKK